MEIWKLTKSLLFASAFISLTLTASAAGYIVHQLRSVGMLTVLLSLLSLFVLRYIFGKWHTIRLFASPYNPFSVLDAIQDGRESKVLILTAPFVALKRKLDEVF